MGRSSSLLQMLFVSLVDSNVGLSGALANGEDRTLFMRAVVIDDSSVHHMSLSGLQGLTVDVRDSVVDLQGPSGASFHIEGAVSADYAGARADLGDAHCAEGDCDASFFPEADDLGDEDDVTLNENPGDPGDVVAWGLCHPAHPECFGAATTGVIDFTVPRAAEVPEASDDVRLPAWALPDGDSGCRYLLAAPANRGGTAPVAPPPVPGLRGGGGWLLLAGLVAGGLRALRRRH